jgi:uncharacterized protein (TIGR01777 family)
MLVAITGAGGFIGRRVVDRLVAGGNKVRALGRSRSAAWPAEVEFFRWDALEAMPQEDALSGADAVIHLAGEPIAQRWTPEAKSRIRLSRLDGTRRLVEALSTVSRRPECLVAASAIGFYGSRRDEVLTEESEAGEGFLPKLCAGWENAARLAEALGIRVVSLRIGLVLGRDGGALKRMLPPFRFGAGGRLASGRQWMSWIHLDDLVSLIEFALLHRHLTGAVNATAPSPVPNSQFTRQLAGALHRPAIFPVPAFALKLMFGEMSQILLASQRVLPRAAEVAGFAFRYPDLGPALTQLLE